MRTAPGGLAAMRTASSFASGSRRSGGSSDTREEDLIDMLSSGKVADRAHPGAQGIAPSGMSREERQSLS
jgi:hypothetical protein